MLRSLLSSNKYRQSNKDKRELLIKELRNDWNITDDFMKCLNDYNESKNKLFKEIGIYKHHWYIMRFSEIFKNEDFCNVQDLQKLVKQYEQKHQN